MLTAFNRSRTPRDEDGLVVVMFALVAVVLLLIAGMVVDLGLARDTRRQSQNAADASALAAANVMYASSGVADFPAALSAAKTYARTNFGVALTSWPGCTDSERLTYAPDPANTCISFDSLTAPSKVRIQIPTREVATTFGSLAGVASIPIRTSAGANIARSAGQPCGLCLLGAGTHNFQNGDVTVSGADIYLNGSADVSSNGLVSTTGQIYVENYASGPSSSYQPAATMNAPRLPDPLADIVLPPATVSALSPKSNPCTDGPGIYSTTQNLNGKVCILQPGLYVIRSGTWDGSGNSAGTLTGAGVTLFFTCSSGNVVTACSSGQQGAKLDASGNYAIQLQAPITGALQGLSIVYDRENVSLLRLTGNGTAFTGTIYGSSATLQINGNGCSNAYQSMLVVSDLVMSGNGTCLKATYAVGQNPAPKVGVGLYQ